MPLEDASGDFTVFISYAHEDNEGPDPSRHWLNRLLQHLRPLVFQKQVRTWSDIAIESGEQWDKSIKAQLQRAKVAVLLVSPAFLASEYIRNSELPALLMKAQDEGLTVLPVIVRPCSYTTATFKYPDAASGPEELSLATFQAVNSPDKPLSAMQEHEQDAAFVAVADRVREIARRDATAPASDVTKAAGGTSTPSKAPAALHALQPRNPFFTGRAQTLDHLHRALVATGKAALSGLGGVGKTQTVIEYAYRHRGEYGAVLLTRADTEDALKSGLSAMATTLNLPERDETDRDVIVAAVKRWLERNTGWLLILDNADDLSLVSDLTRRDWGGHLLLTTRAHATGGVDKVEIKEMPPEEGALFLLRRAKLIALDDTLAAATESDHKLATKITHEVDGLPLALDQAGAFIEEMSSSLDEYLELYRQEGAQLRAARGGIAPDHEPVTITFSLAFQQVERTNAAAGDMLRACAFLAPDAIPEEIFTTGATHLGDNLAPMSDGGLALVKMLADAARFSLIRRDAKNSTIQIHRLVQQVLKDEMDAATRRLWAERTVRALNEAFPDVEYETWPLCEKLLPHSQEAARLIEEYGFEFHEAARLLNEAGHYCKQRAQYAESEPLLVRSLDIRERIFGPEHPNVATSLNNLAALYDDQGRYAEAESLHVRALSIKEKVLAPEHPDVASTLNNLAHLYHNQGRYAEAEPLYVRALNIREKALGPEHPNVAVSLNNLGLLYRDQGKHTEAEPMYLRALRIWEKVFGLEHPNVAVSLNNLGALYNDQGKFAEAEPQLVRSLSIHEKALGSEHPNLALSLNNLAITYMGQGKHAEAEPLMGRALRIYESTLGREHPVSSLIRENYTELLRRMGRKIEE